MSGQEGGNKRKRSTRLKWIDSNSNSNIKIRKSKRKTKPIDRMEMVMENVINQMMDEKKQGLKTKFRDKYSAMHLSIQQKQK